MIATTLSYSCWCSIYESYRTSGLNVKAFYAQILPNLIPAPIPSLSTTYLWIKRLSAARPLPTDAHAELSSCPVIKREIAPNVSLVTVAPADLPEAPVPPVATRSVATASRQVRVSLSNGTVVEFESDSPEAFVLQLLQNNVGGLP